MLLKMDAKICKYHQHGHCKFGSACRNIHTLEICTNTLCDRLTCPFRHPKLCKYHSRYENCVFGTSCSYLHVYKENEIETLRKDLNNVLALLNAKENEIKALEVKVTKLECQFQVLHCDNCNSNTTIATVFSKHVDTAHEAANIPLTSSLPVPASLPPALPTGTRPRMCTKCGLPSKGHQGPCGDKCKLNETLA